MWHTVYKVRDGVMTPVLKRKRNQGGAVTPHAVRRQRKRAAGPSKSKSKAKAKAKAKKEGKLAPVELPDDFEETKGDTAILVAQVEPLVMQEIGTYK